MVPVQIVAFWNAASTRWNPVAVIVGAWAVLTMPLIFFRGCNADEGLAVINARTAVEDGYWLNTHTFNVRFVERPTLLLSIIAVISEPFGHVSQVAERLPVALFLLLGCLLIYALLRKVATSVPAALFGHRPVSRLPAGDAVICHDHGGHAACGLVVSRLRAVVGRLRKRNTRLWTVDRDRPRSGARRPDERTAAGELLRARIGLFVLGSRSWRQITGLIVAGIVCVIALAAWCGAVYAQGDKAQWATFMRLRAGRIAAGTDRSKLQSRD